MTACVHDCHSPMVLTVRYYSCRKAPYSVFCSSCGLVIFKRRMLTGWHVVRSLGEWEPVFFRRVLTNSSYY